MDTKKLYNDAYIKTKISEASFCRAFNDAANYIASKYGRKYADGQSDASLCINKVGDESSLFEIYAPAVTAYISYISDKSDAHRADFITLCDRAYCNVWRERVKGKRIRGCSF